MMKKIFSFLTVIMLLCGVGCMTAFAEGGDIGTAFSAVKDEFGNIYVSETDQDGSTFDYIIPADKQESEAVEEVCPKCGKIHDGCCEQEVVRPHTMLHGEVYLTFCEMKDNALYFITPENQLMLMNLKTKELMVIANDVAGLIRSGMNGRNIEYVTLEEKVIPVPYEIGKDGKLLTTDFQEEIIK